MALCTQADIEFLRQIDVTAEPDAALTALIRHAEGILEGECARRFDPVTDEVLLVDDAVVVDANIYLPHYPITAIEITDPESVVMTPEVDYHLTPFGKVTRLGPGTGVYTWDWQYNITAGLPHWRAGTSITYSGGILDPDAEGAPQDLRTVCAQVASRLFDEGVVSAEGGAGIQSETIGGWSVAYVASMADLTPQQKRTLRRYRHQVPVVAF